MEEIAGPRAFQVAKDSLNRRMTNRDKLETSKLQLTKEGSQERIFANELELAEKRVFNQLKQLKESTEIVKVNQGDRIRQAESFIAQQKLTNNLLKPFVSAEQRFCSVRKLQVCGSPVMSNLFEWPSQSELRLETLDNLTASKLTKIEYHVGGSIWSTQISMSDGRQSPVFGSRNVLDQELHLDPNEEIGQIQILQSSDRKYVNSIKFMAR